MTGNEALFLFLDALREEQVPHMVVGGYSSNYWGLPRATKDADIVVEASKLEWSKLLDRLPPEFTLDEQITFETITGSRRDILRVEGMAFFLEVFHLSDDSFNQARFGRRIEVTLFPGRTVYVPTPEDVIIQKLRWFELNNTREKDFTDTVEIFKVRAAKLDHAHLEHWCAEHGTTDLLKEAKSRAGL